MDLNYRDLVTSLASAVCPACSRRKVQSQTFCKGCYYKLNAEQRRRLYDRIGQGYEEAVTSAMATLKASIFLTPEMAKHGKPQGSLFESGPREGMGR